MTGSCQACGEWRQLDRSHVLTRGAGAGWGKHEYLTMCRLCHTRQGSLGWYRMVKAFPHLMAILNDKGFEFEFEFGVWRLRSTR